MNFEYLESYDALSEQAASILLAGISVSSHVTLGLPTGRTPIGMYRQVVASSSNQALSFRNVETFNLDEYAGIAPEHPGSYHTYMHQHLLDRVGIETANVHIPNGVAVDLPSECSRYEAAIELAGGLDLTFLGLGTNGHIGFNEPGTPFDSVTRLVALSGSTRAANASQFPGGRVPTHAITMGIGTILRSRRIVLLASGERKREAIERLRGGNVDEMFPASALWLHPDVLVLISGQ